jgi:hypothetical protein
VYVIGQPGSQNGNSGLVGVKTHEENNMADQFKCSKCGKTFSSQSELKEHEKNCNKK